MKELVIRDVQDGAVIAPPEQFNVEGCKHSKHIRQFFDGRKMLCSIPGCLSGIPGRDLVMAKLIREPRLWAELLTPQIQPGQYERVIFERVEYFDAPGAVRYWRWEQR